jgi:hypothetical protein
VGLGIGEIVVFVALTAIVLLGLSIALWVLRKTLTMVKRLVLVGVAGAVLAIAAVAGVALWAWTSFHH